MNDRTFGVELEFHLTSNSTHSRVRQLILDAGLPHWEHEYWLGHDGSGIELRTPILSGQKGMNELRIAMQALTAGGGVCNTQDGMHVHHGAPEFVDNKELMTLIAESWANCRGIIGKFVDPRRNNPGYPCPDQWKGQKLAALKAADATPDPRYIGLQPYANYTKLRTACAGRGDMNLGALYEHGTIELRLHEGTLDADRAEAWVRFGQRFITTILKRGTPLQATDAKELLRKVRCPKIATERLLERAGEMVAIRDEQTKLIREYSLA